MYDASGTVYSLIGERVGRTGQIFGGGFAAGQWCTWYCQRVLSSPSIACLKSELGSACLMDDLRFFI